VWPDPAAIENADECQQAFDQTLEAIERRIDDFLQA